MAMLALPMGRGCKRLARIRTIKPEFYHNEELSALAAEIHLFAGGLINQADDEGYFHAHAGLLMAAIFPLRECSVSAPDMLRELSRIGFIRLGSTPDGKKWGHIVTFLDHQVISHPSKSKIKGLEIIWEDSSNTPVSVMDNSIGKGRKERKELGKEWKELEPSSTCVDVPVSAQPKIRKALILEMVKRLFIFYCQEVKRDPERYTLTDRRRDAAVRRLTARMDILEDLGSVEEEAMQAIRNLKASDFHMQGGYFDWDDHIFRSQEMYEKRLNWKPPEIHKNGAVEHNGKIMAPGYIPLPAKKEGQR